jgi:hypothetical protein
VKKYLLFTTSLVASLYFWYYAQTYTQWHFIDSVNLIFHEAGHTLFSFFGEHIHAFMGSGFQLLVPLGISFYFFYQKQYLSAALCLFWVAQNILNISVYVGDALQMQLDLLGGDSSIHDWNYLLGEFNLLSYTNTIASFLHTIGMFVLYTATVSSLYYSWVYTATQSKDRPII